MLKSFVGLCAVVLCLSAGQAQDTIMGNWEGQYRTEGGDSGEVLAKVIALGGGAYKSVVSVPAFGFQFSLEGKKEGEKGLFGGQVEVAPGMGLFDFQVEVTAELLSGKFTNPSYSGTLEMKRVQKPSATLGMAGPPGALVLFDGVNLESWQQANGAPAGWQILPDGAMEVRKGSILTRMEFGSARIHLEFRTPFMPEAQGQARGNSGVYIQNLYEIQILDSFGLDPKDNECGAVYRATAPRVNVCLPPLEWQTYDILFTAPEIDASGNKVKDAEVTVELNGILIHDKVKITGPTGGAKDRPEKGRGPLLLQDHGNPVQFRNVWLLPQ